VSKSDQKAKPAEKPAFQRSEEAAQSVNRVFGKPSVPPLKISETGLVPDHPDTLAGLALIMEAIGTRDPDFGWGILSQLLEIAGSGKSRQEILNFALAFVKGMKPQNHAEAALATQMAATHLASMKFALNLENNSSLVVCECVERIMTRLMRTYANQTETFKRCRNGGEQTVTVKHVNVSEGGNRRRQPPPRSSRDSGLGSAPANQTHQNVPMLDREKANEAVPISIARSKQK
jgi:hypothetical protein